MPTLEPEASYIEKYGALPSHAEIEAYRVELRERFDIDFDLEWKTYWLERASNDPAGHSACALGSGRAKLEPWRAGTLWPHGSGL